MNCQLTTHYSPFTKKALAFTLAETLIVMGIIGIVSALTLPNLNSSTGDKEKVAQLKKLYQNLTDAVGRAESVYGPKGTWSNGTSQLWVRAGERLTEFLKTSKVCGTSSPTTCFPESKCYSGDYGCTGCYVSDTDVYTFILGDGSSVCINEFASEILVDIDGPKGKNALGKDVFIFSWTTNEGLTPRGYGATFDPTSGADQAAWVIYNENMDYMKCSGLNWTTKTSCK